MSWLLRKSCFAILCLAAALIISGCGSVPPPPSKITIEPNPIETEIRVHEYKNETAIDFRYSTDWTLVVPQFGFLVTGPSDVVIGDEPGPLVSVLRIPISEVHGNLEGEFNHYLDFGPRRDGYETVKDVTDFELDGRPAKRIRMSFTGNEEENTISQEAIIVGAEANNGVVYIISATAPPEDWDYNNILFNLLIQSVKFNE